MNEATPRATCPRCFRPTVVCFCHLVVPHRTRTRVVILQHPRERTVPVNTARIAALCLPDAELHVGVRWSGSRELASAIGDRDRPAALLYPGPDAIDVELEPPTSPITLVVVDGTWAQARKVVRENPELAALPRYAFRPRVPSQYRIRSEPHEHCVSTIEALAFVLGVLEGEPDRFRRILEPFFAMVDRQVEFAQGGGGRRHVHRKREPVHPGARVPRALTERYRDLVCVHAEVNAWPYGSVERAALGDDLLQWVACRVATGETFEAIVQPPNRLAPNVLRHLELDARALDAAVDREAFARAWAEFLRPSDVVCAWGSYGIRMLERAGARAPEARVDLRHAARVFTRGKVGSFEELCVRLGVSYEPVTGASGRGARRIAQLRSITNALANAGTEAASRSSDGVLAELATHRGFDIHARAEREQ